MQAAEEEPADLGGGSGQDDLPAHKSSESAGVGATPAAPEVAAPAKKKQKFLQSVLSKFAHVPGVMPPPPKASGGDAEDGARAEVVAKGVPRECCRSHWPREPLVVCLLMSLL